MTMYGGRIEGPGVHRDVGQTLGSNIFWKLLRMSNEGADVGIDHGESEISGRMKGEQLLELLPKSLDFDYDGEIKFLRERLRPDRTYGVSAWEL